MSTTPPPGEPPATPGTPPPASEPPPAADRPAARPAWMANRPTEAWLPIPGNAELLLYVVALIVAWLVCWISDSLTADDWFFFFAVTTAVYILSRGIAKASRVLEQ
jgi:uncharacterized membrane protein YcjF (UPF0283 family)